MTTDPKFLVLEDLNPFQTVSKVQEASSILRVDFALPKWPHLHRAYLVTVLFDMILSVYGRPYDGTIWLYIYF